jgi:photosystem II stability/assembly factor-like uncharacterized protein
VKPNAGSARSVPNVGHNWEEPSILKTFLLLLLAPAAFAQTWVLENTGSTASLRGVSVVDSKTAWASGTGGTFLRTIDGGETWHAGSVPEAASLDFRGVEAFSARSSVLMASGEGPKSAIYKTSDGGATWRLLYPNRDAKGFFDAIAFADAGQGMILGDPVDGTFMLFRLDLAGTAQPRIPLPPALAGEGAYAASDSSLVVRGKHIWFATGGPGAARVFHSEDRGKHWKVSTTPIRNDVEGAGIFSIAFRDLKNGIAVGGNYAKPNEHAHNVALTNDGGATWTEPTGKHPRGYRSGVAWVARDKLWIAVGPTGSEFSRDMGQTWIPFDNDAFNAIGVGADGSCLAVGPKGRIAVLLDQLLQ